MSENKMRRVYHFIKSGHGLDNVQKKRLKISTILGLNDPFEMFSHDVKNPSVRELSKFGKESFSKEFGIICFSKSSYSPVQWAHYAERNTGLCLGFDIHEDLLMDVKYLDGRLKGVSFPTDPRFAEKWMKEVLSTKYSAWSYEGETRCFARLEVEEDGRYFKEFDEGLILKEIQVGFHSKITRAQIASAVGDDYGYVESFKVRPAFGSFQMVRNKDESLWT